MKTCAPAANCITDPDPNDGSTHPCQIRKNAQDENEYYCQIRAFEDGDGSSLTNDNPDGIFNGLGPLESSSCPDVHLESSSGDVNVYESDFICEAYGAKVEAGLTCEASADCDSNGCALDESDGYYKCTLIRDTACTDVETFKELVSAATVNPAVPATHQYPELASTYCNGNKIYFNSFK